MVVTQDVEVIFDAMPTLDTHQRGELHFVAMLDCGKLANDAGVVQMLLEPVGLDQRLGMRVLSRMRVHALKVERTTGGTKFTLPEFGLTAAVVFTDQANGLVARFQDQERQTSKTAAKWAHDLAEEAAPFIEASDYCRDVYDGLQTRQREIDRVYPDAGGYYSVGAYLWPWTRAAPQ